MSDYYIYSYLCLEYQLFDSEKVPLHLEGFELKHNQELPEDESTEIISDGKWESEEYKLKYKKYISPIFTPESMTLNRVVRLHPIPKNFQ